MRNTVNAVCFFNFVHVHKLKASQVSNLYDVQPELVSLTLANFSFTVEISLQSNGNAYQIKRGVYFEGDLQSTPGYIHCGLHTRRAPGMTDLVATVGYLTESSHVCSVTTSSREAAAVRVHCVVGERVHVEGLCTSSVCAIINTLYDGSMINYR